GTILVMGRVVGCDVSDSDCSILCSTCLLADFHPSSDNTSKCFIPSELHSTLTCISARLFHFWLSSTYSRRPLYPPPMLSRMVSCAKTLAITWSALSEATAGAWPNTLPPRQIREAMMMMRFFMSELEYQLSAKRPPCVVVEMAKL